MAEVEALVFENPLPGVEPRRVRAAIGSPVRDIVAGCKAPMVCTIDGRPLARDYWMQREVCEGDSIEFHPVFLGGGGSRSILGAIASIALSAILPGFVAGLSPALFGTATALTNLGRLVVAGLVMLGNALISAILPAGNRSGNMQGDKASSIYDVDTQGNAAKIFNPIPVQYGRLKAYPDYAAQPYVHYRTDTNPDGDQYYYALFCLGHGEYEVEEITIGDAPITSFADILTSHILPPGQSPEIVKPNVVTSEAVSGQSLDSGENVGGFPVCGPGRIARRISFDIVFPQGLCKLDGNGKAQENSVTIIADTAPISASGQQIGNWVNVFTQTISASSLTPQRRSFDIDVEPGRYMLRVRREGARDVKDNQNMSACQWQSLRAELTTPAPLCKTATHYELVMRASEQLSSLSQRKIAIICTRKVKDFSGDLVPSRSPILALLDKWTNADYGDGLSEDRIDTATLQKYYALAEERQDRFDYRFESRVTSEEADQLIAKVHRCVVLQRQGVKTLVRDELAELPITLFSPTNTTEGSVSLDYVQVTEETSDGVIAEYFSRDTWTWEEEECPAPGRTYTVDTHPGYDPALPPMDNPARIRLEGITGRNHAIREGMYYAATNALRRQFIAWQTELQGALVYYGAPVIFTSTLYNSDGSGEVIDDRDDGAIRLSSDIPAGSMVSFMRADGSVTTPASVTSLGDGWIMPPGISVNYGDYATERTRFAVLTGEIARRLVKITAVEPRGMGNTGAPEYQLRGVVDVPEVHTVDEPWLPKDDEIQDVPSWDTDYDGPAPETPQLNVVFGNQVVSTYFAQWNGGGNPATVVFYPDGRTRFKYYSRGTGVAEESYSPNGEFGINVSHSVDWLGNIVENAGGSYEVSLGFVFDAPETFEKFLWLDDAQPERNMILRGHRCKKITYEVAKLVDESTQQLLLSLSKKVGLFDEKTPYLTDWESIGSRIEFSSGYENMGAVIVDGGLTTLRMPPFSGVYGIRDKATKTLQGTGTFILYTRDLSEYVP